MAATRRSLIEKSMPASSRVPAKRSSEPIGVTPTFASMRRRGSSGGAAGLLNVRL
jgi:hypothetical protein